VRVPVCPVATKETIGALARSKVVFIDIATCKGNRRVTFRGTFKLDKRYRFFRNVWNNVHLQEQKFGLIFLGASYQQTAKLEDPG